MTDVSKPFESNFLFSCRKHNAAGKFTNMMRSIPWSKWENARYPFFNTATWYQVMNNVQIDSSKFCFNEAGCSAYAYIHHKQMTRFLDQYVPLQWRMTAHDNRRLYQGVDGVALPACLLWLLWLLLLLLMVSVRSLLGLRIHVDDRQSVCYF